MIHSIGINSTTYFHIYLQNQAFRSSSWIVFFSIRSSSLIIFFVIIFLLFFQCYSINNNEMKKNCSEFFFICIFLVINCFACYILCQKIISILLYSIKRHLSNFMKIANCFCSADICSVQCKVLKENGRDLLNAALKEHMV